MVLLNALSLTLVFAYARMLLDLPTALLAAAFSALSPFLIAHTHLMHLDGLAGSLMVLSLVAFLSYVDRQETINLLVSGVAAGLAWLTKTPALALGPIFLIISLLIMWFNRGSGRMNWRGSLLTFLVWAVIGLATFILLWPAMWVESLNTLSQILGEALGYAGSGHGDPVFFNGTIYKNGRIPASVFTFYPITVLWRSTPVILLGLVLVILALWRQWPPLDRRLARTSIFALLLYALLFALFMTFGDKKFDRYLIPIYPALHLAAAAGWVGMANAVAGRWFAGSQRNPLILVILLALVAAWQLLAVSRAYPYPLSHYNALLGGSERAPQVMQIGWGEGLDAAGRYLSGKPGSDQPTIASWYRSALAYYFDGPTISIKADLSPEEMAAIQSADYAVIYIHQWQRDTPAELLDFFETQTPEHIIEINGLEYARIYELRP
jgi:4-amino-4-deoxy-L-arabinose transferase-like glycosyltransferase